MLVEEEMLRPAESAVQEAQAVEQQEELVLPSVCREEAEYKQAGEAAEAEAHISQRIPPESHNHTKHYLSVWYPRRKYRSTPKLIHLDSNIWILSVEKAKGHLMPQQHQ